MIFTIYKSPKYS